MADPRTGEAHATGPAAGPPCEQDIGPGLAGFLHEVYGGLDRGEFIVLYQPVVDVASHGLDGFEALVRWSHPRYGLLTPDAFVPLLERSGHLAALTGFVLAQACDAAASWSTGGATAPRVRVNVPIGLFGEARLLGDIDAALARTDLDPARLVVEITESGVLSNVPAAQAACRQLRAAGSTIALDDFVGGDSDVARLVLLDVHELKVDRSMVAGLPADRLARTSVRRILDMATAMDLQVTAEGVETAAQLDALRAVGATAMQGFLFGRPRILDGPEHVRVLARRCRALLEAAPAGSEVLHEAITRSG